jgi:hypothetical protein
MVSLNDDEVEYELSPSCEQYFLTQDEFLEHGTLPPFPYLMVHGNNLEGLGLGLSLEHVKDGNISTEVNVFGSSSTNYVNGGSFPLKDYLAIHPLHVNSMLGDPGNLQGGLEEEAKVGSKHFLVFFLSPGLWILIQCENLSLI